MSGTNPVTEPEHPIGPYIGLDVGSATAKVVLRDAGTGQILWKRYERHNGRQLAKALDLLRDLSAHHPDIESGTTHVFVTGSGTGNLERLIGAKYVQEVNAVACAVERMYPEVGSVVELGGQDAKMIIFRQDPVTGRKSKVLSMNDKCAGGTGVVLDKIAAKLGIPSDELGAQGYDGIKLHHVAGRCGVFAETDANSLQVMGVPKEQVMASLFDAIVSQNLAVLTRGHTLLPHVLLLGGPNRFIEGLAQAWRAHIPATWRERGTTLPAGADPRDLIIVPEDAEYFAAFGAIEYGLQEPRGVGVYRGLSDLEGRVAQPERRRAPGACSALSSGAMDLRRFRETFKKPHFEPAIVRAGEAVQAFLGLDGGSTSTKAVLLDRNAEVLFKAYQLSKGNPIEDTKEVVAELRASVERQGATLDVLGFAVTGYAKDVLKEVFGADVAIVETVAHAKSALQLYGDVDVICDVGGQDIKIMVLSGGQVKDFKLNTQCSAGNGYFLQSTAESLGFSVDEYAEAAFQADSMPSFSYGCAVFLQSDIVNFQRQGWTPRQILAGLAAVLPKNIWLYVAQVPNPARLGSTFVLQGGTQYNLAAVKAHVDFIRAKCRERGVEPKIIVHEHCGESGAIGAALEAIRLHRSGTPSTFVGLDEVARTACSTMTGETTRCGFCRNGCLRTFIDVQVLLGNGARPLPVLPDAGASVARGARRLIVGTGCEKGLVDDVASMRLIKRRLDEALADTRNLADIQARTAFQSYSPAPQADAQPRWSLGRSHKKWLARRRERESLRVGIPRVLAMYNVAPLFRTYFEALGIRPRNVVFSDCTSQRLFKEGATRGAIDPCFPGKVAIPHVHHLLYRQHARDPLDLIFFPMIDDVPSALVNAMGHRICPTITATPQSVRAAFTKEADVFAEMGVDFLTPFLNIGQRELFERQMYTGLRDTLGLSVAENRRAIESGLEALAAFEGGLRSEARAELDRIERESRVGIVVLGRPYHADKGINHDILVEFQKRHYPVFTPMSLPIDGDVIERLFGDEIREGLITHGLDITDVWKNAYSENSNWKIFAAKFAARHPNLVAVEIGSFRCGHDAPLFSVLESIVETSGTPFFHFRDLDENKPSGSIKIRVETIDYFLRRYRESLARRVPAPRCP